MRRSRAWRTDKGFEVMDWYNRECCNKPLTLDHVTLAHFPYIHVDIHTYCNKCGRHYVFGVPLDHYAGMAIHLFSEVSPEILETTPLKCPFCGAETKLTKAMKIDDGRYWVQFKCGRCYYAKHKEVHLK